ncbi:MAG TPA: hypothetical protein DDY86_03615 [Syntrophaceae bacterium]|nr:hypothetical protein [Syntrophaceae bacterium]
MICPNCLKKLKVIDSRETSPGSNERIQKCVCPECEQKYCVAVKNERPDVATTITTKKLMTGYPA